MTRSRVALGAWGEACAAEYLESLGYRIVERNVRTRRAEIDIVAWDRSTLVFVEVRTRRTDRWGSALESVARQKRERLAGAARAYLGRRRLLEANCRFDVIGIGWAPGEGRPRIDHVRNAFSLT